MRRCEETRCSITTEIRPSRHDTLLVSKLARIDVTAHLWHFSILPRFGPLVHLNSDRPIGFEIAQSAAQLYNKCGVLESLGAMASQRRKQRPIRSCLTCRARRVRCDKANPICANCARADRSCLYSDAADGSKSEETRISPPPNKRRRLDNPQRGRQEMGHVARLPGNRTRYVGPSFWGISEKDVEHSSFALASVSR